MFTYQFAVVEGQTFSSKEEDEEEEKEENERKEEDVDQRSNKGRKMNKKIITNRNNVRNEKNIMAMQKKCIKKMGVQKMQKIAKIRFFCKNSFF